ncbi:MAG: dihydropteroate synthase [Rikenellaceae bacterium]
MKPSEINLDFYQPQVMAILNVTPDSFFEESCKFSIEHIEDRVNQIVAEGATIIDVGGYSSRPGAEEVSIEEEWSRVERGIKAVRKVSANIAISLDTFRAEVAERALKKFGALIINDISAGELDPRIIEVVAKYRVPYIAMHMRGTPQTMQHKTTYNNVVEDIARYFEQRTEHLIACGVSRIIIDPGFGFAKTIDQNYEIIAGLSRLVALGYPVLVGVSRKSMIYKLLGCNADNALAGTIALNWEALSQGASILRVHDVREAADVVKIYNKFLEI